MEKNQLPKDWKWVKLGEFVISVKGKKPKRVSKEKTKECSIPYVNIKAFEKNIIDEYTDGVGCALCEDGDFLMVWDGSRSGYVGKAIKGAIGSTLVKLNFPDIENNYAYYFLQSKFIEINTRAKGVGIPHVDPNILWNYDLLIPPKPIQQAIVSKIEELFSEIENGIKSLFTAKEQLKKYRQSVLKWAFEGKLANGLNGDLYDLPDEHDLSIAAEPETEYRVERNQNNQKNHSSDKREMPEGWKWVKLGEISQSVLGKMLDRQKNEGALKPYLRNINVRWNEFKLDDIFEMRFQENEDERFGIVKGDLIICEGGEPGRAAIWKGQIQNMKIQKALHRVRFNKSACAEYFLYYLNLISSTKLLDQYFTGTTIKHLTGQSLKNISIPLAPIREQNIIVQAIESRLSVADKMEESITESLQQAEALKQSILKKAFKGKLIK